ncbi:MAG TPA: DNA polymerase Y family protein [Burkholderiales bacterium]|nr:DNA polymerase Y family protein [Burkholderiales bacterium]
MLWVALYLPCLRPDSLEPIAAWACQFTPRVSLEPPQALLAEVEGSLRLFGGRDALLSRIREGLSALDVEGSIAVAPTALAALWLARARAEKLEDVPLREAGFAEESVAFLRSVGVATVKDMLELPREGLAGRCGQALIDALDRALGVLPEAREFFAPPACFDARLELPSPVSHAEALLFASRRLLVQLEGLLTARHAGIRRFLLNGIEIGLSSPSRDAKRMEQLLREKLATVTLAHPTEEVRLQARDFEPLVGRSAGMFGDAAANAEDWARLLERLRQRLGRDGVFGIATSPDHRPEHAWQRVEPGEWDPREFVQPGPRPLWLLPQPRRLGESTFALLAGPERIECGWWDGDDAQRDYFIAELPDASLGWIYREAGEWYLHGLFA